MIQIGVWVTCWQRMAQFVNVSLDDNSPDLDANKAILNNTFSKDDSQNGQEKMDEPIWALVSPRGIVAILQLASVVFSQVGTTLSVDLSI